MIEESEPGHSVDRKKHAPTDAHRSVYGHTK